MGRLVHVFPGYQVSYAGSVIGLGYGLVTGFVTGWLTAYFRDFIVAFPSARPSPKKKTRLWVAASFARRRREALALAPDFLGAVFRVVLFVDFFEGFLATFFTAFFAAFLAGFRVAAAFAFFFLAVTGFRALTSPPPNDPSNAAIDSRPGPAPAPSCPDHGR